MKIHYCSDLHLEFSDVPRPLPKGDVMILAGDITLAGVLDESDVLHYRRPKLWSLSERFFDDVRANFNRVFYLIGNHEAYDYNLSKTPETLKKAFGNRGIELLDDDAFDLDAETVLVGGTLWTDMNRDSPSSHRVVSEMMNDFRLIHTGDGSHRFTTHDAVDRHKITLARIALAAKENPEKTIIVATHHAPSLKGINPQHQGSATNPGYASDLSGFIKQHKNIKHWVFGHTHLQTEFKIGQCTLHSNARGYAGREHSAETFDMDRYFSVKAPEKIVVVNAVHHRVSS